MSLAAAVLGKSTATAKGGELVARMLAAEGVTRVFGIMDGSYLGLCAALRPNGIDLVTPRHETSAAHMAGAYAQLTGKLGVCIASNGPGVANILPGVAVEQAEGHRVLLITSCRREGIVYPDRGGTYQSFPQVEVTRPMTKWSGVVPSMARLAEFVRRALRESFEGRPGVVHLDIPESVVNGVLELGPDALRPPSSYRTTTPMEAPAEQVREVARWLDEAKLPLIHAGSGVMWAGATKELAELAALLEAPVTTSWAARAVIDERDPHSISMIFVGAVNKARNAADRVLVLGSRLGETDWWGKAPYWGDPQEQEVAQVDIDADTLGNIRGVRFAVRADAKAFLKALLAELGRLRGGRDLRARREHLAKLRAACAARRAELDKNRTDDSVPMHSAHVARICQETFAEDAIMVADGGNTTIWAQFFHEVRTVNSTLGTPKMGMLGAGVSQALGAQVACPDRQVYCVIGDGAMGFHPQEIETAVRNRLPVVYLVLCDKQWGMVKINQSFALKPLKTLVLKTLGPDETINADLGEIEFDLLARSMGAHGERVADPKGLKGAIQRALASGKPAVIHVDVDPVKHMWAPELKTFKDMHQEPGEVTSVLVTGAAGYVGRKLVRALARDPGAFSTLVATDVRDVPEAEREPGVRYEKVDVRSADLGALLAQHRIDTVVHLATIVSPGKHLSREVQYDVDVRGTENVLEACVREGVSRLVVTSSGAAYGYHADSPALLTEDAPLRGNQEFAYSHHKRLVEELLERARQEHPSLAQLVFRPGTILGPGAKNQITDIFTKPVIIGLRDSDTPFVFVSDEDVVRAISQGVREGWTGTYNLAGEGVMTLREIAARLGKRFVGIPEQALRTGIRVLRRFGATQYGPEQTAFLAHRPVLSSEKLRREHGFRLLASRAVFEAWAS